MLVEFASVVDAVRCAMEVQAAMAGATPPLPPERRIAFRIGINLGDIIIEDDDIFGDGVNVAARLEGLAEPGGICVTARVRDHVAQTASISPSRTWASRRSRTSRGRSALIVCGRQAGIGTSAPRSRRLPLPDKPSIAVLPFAES